MYEEFVKVIAGVRKKIIYRVETWFYENISK